MIMQVKKPAFVFFIVLSLSIVSAGCVGCIPTKHVNTLTPTPIVIVVTPEPTPAVTPVPYNGTVEITGKIPGNVANQQPTKVVQGYVYINGVPQQSIAVEITTTYTVVIPTDGNGYFYYVADHSGDENGSSYTIAIVDKNWNKIFEDNTPRPFDGKMLNISLTT
jgi:hypothetical protein